MKIKALKLEDFGTEKLSKNHQKTVLGGSDSDIKDPIRGGGHTSSGGGNT